MWRLTQAPKTLKATKKLAEEFATMDPAPQDRPLSTRRLEVYKKIMEAGGFRPISWASTTCSETNGLYRVNGKHTSILLSSIDVIPENLYIVIERFHCDTLKDVAHLYSSYDSKMQARTTSDINRSFASAVPELEEIPNALINRIIAGICFHKDGEQYTNKRQPIERAEEILDNVKFALWLYNIVEHSRRKNSHLCRVAVIAAMYGTWMRSQIEASIFWKLVRDETGDSPTTPDRKLARFLVLNGSTKAVKSTKAERYRVSDKEFYVKSLHAWNAWRKKETTNLNFYANAPIPAIR